MATNGPIFPSFSKSPDLSLKSIYEAGEDKAYETFCKLALAVNR
jgi:hypothetical protein